MNRDVSKDNTKLAIKFNNLYLDSYTEDDSDEFFEPHEEIERHLREEFGYDKEHARKELNSFGRDCDWDEDY